MTKRLKTMASAIAFLLCAIATQCADAYDWSSASGKVTVPSGESYVVGDADISAVNALSEIVVSGELVFTCSAAPTVAISGSGRVVKRSNYDWTLSRSLDAFTGFYVLEGGTTVTDKYGQFGSTGSTDGGVVVSNGATLFMTGSAEKQNYFNNRPLYISGSGVDGEGALVTAGNAGAYNFVKTFTLLGNATVKLARESYFYGGSGRIDIGEHTLTVNGGPMNIRPGSVVTGAGRIILGQNGQVFVCENGRISDENVETAPIELKEGAKYTFYNDAPPQNRPILVSGANATLNHTEQYGYGHESGWHGWTDAYNNQCGPVVFTADDAYLRLDARDYRCQLTISGMISGPGSVKIGESGYESGRFVFSCPTNSYSGSTHIKGSKGAFLVAYASNSIPSYAGVTCLYSRVSAVLSEDDSTWCEDSLKRLMLNGTWLNQSMLALDTSNLPSKAYRVDGAAWESSVPADRLWSIGHDGEGLLTVDGPVSRANSMASYAGTLMITGSQFSVANLMAVGDTGREGGTVFVGDGADVVLTNAFTIGSFLNTAIDPVPTAHALISNATVRIGELSAENNFFGSTQGLQVGRYGVGTLDICSGSVVTARVNNALNNSSAAAVFQKDSHVTAWGSGLNNDTQNMNFIANAGYGYWNVAGGSLDLLGYTSIVHWGGGNAGQYDAQGILDVTGGMVRHGAHAAADNAVTGAKSCLMTTRAGAGWAAIRVAGSGKMETSQGVPFYLGTGGNYSESHLILDGEEASVVLGSGVTFNDGDKTRSFVDLYAGSLQGNLFQRAPNKPNSVAYLNFNGGSLRPSGWGNSLFGVAANDNALTRVTVYERGAVFDMYNHNNYVDIPIECPSGKGIVEAPVPDGLENETFIGPPMVHVKAIDGGDGATLWPEWDRATGKLTGIRVISPGNDYENGATIVVRCGTKTWSTPAVVGKVAGGALTVKGITSLELRATNTWSGGTVICDTASLVAWCDWAIPSNTVLTLNGGMLNLRNNKAIFAGVRGAGGEVKNGSIKISDVWKYDAADFIAGMQTVVKGNIEFLPGSKIEIANPELLLDRTEPAKRSVKFVTATSISGTPEFVVPGSVPAWFKLNGNTLSFGVRKGFLMIFR